MGVEVTHVPYRGTAPSMLAVLNGEVLFNIDNAPTSRPHVQSGALRAIGVSTLRRATTMPDLPTLAEQGVAGFDVASWYGIAAPVATPPPVVAKLAGVLLDAVADPGTVARLAEIRRRALAAGDHRLQRLHAHGGGALGAGGASLGRHPGLRSGGSMHAGDPSAAGREGPDRHAQRTRTGF